MMLQEPDNIAVDITYIHIGLLIAFDSISWRERLVMTNRFSKASILRTRYTLGYAPANSNLDGKFRKLKLEVRPQVEAREGKVVVRTRQGCYARSRDQAGYEQGKQPHAEKKQIAQ